MKAPAGTEVSLYVDLAASVAPGDIIETRSGRRYLVSEVRVQLGGKRAGRQHLRAVVIDSDATMPADHVVHRIRWYRRDRAGGVKQRGRR